MDLLLKWRVYGIAERNVFLTNFPEINFALKATPIEIVDGV